MLNSIIKYKQKWDKLKENNLVKILSPHEVLAKNFYNLKKEFFDKLKTIPEYKPINLIRKNEKFNLNLIEEKCITGIYKISLILPIFYTQHKTIIQISIYDHICQDLKYIKNYFIKGISRENISINLPYFKRSNLEENIVLTIYNLGEDIYFENNFKINIYPTTF